MTAGGTIKVLIWTSIPNHYNAALFDALRASGIDLAVCYYEPVPSERTSMGWSRFEDLPPGEFRVDRREQCLERVPDWRERVHVIPGYGSRFSLHLAQVLSAERCRWVHWSEAARPGSRWWLTYPLKRLYAGLVNRYALGALAIGESAAADFVRWGIARDRIALFPYCVAPPGGQDEPDRACVDFKANRKAFVFAGSLCHRKGIDLLLRAFARGAGRPGAWVLILAGNDLKSGAYQRLAERLGVRDRVLFRGVVEPVAIGSVLAAADVFVLPSRFDGWGVGVNEAAACGLPLIVSDGCGAARHLVETGFNGAVVEAGSVSSLERALDLYLREPEAIEKHGQASKVVFSQWSCPAVARRFRAIVETWIFTTSRAYADRAS
ncbi:MAG: glycosyltransferase family 4 protein [Myxococcales bacterium]